MESRELPPKPTRRRPRLPARGLFLAHELAAYEPPASAADAASPDRLTPADFAFTCFLCDRPLTDQAGSELQDTGEHVIPQWMQRHFGLPSVHTTFGDPASRVYDDAQVPACWECNTLYLSRGEDRLAQAFRKGFPGVSARPRRDLFLWCAKVYYGLIHLDTVSRDPTTHELGVPTLSTDLLRDLAFVRLLLQAFRKRVVVVGPDRLPFSLLVFPLLCGRDLGCYFRIKQATLFPGMALQLGPVGVIAVLDDFGETEDWYAAALQPALDTRTLHPVQFWELAGRLLYQSLIHPCATAFAAIDSAEELTLMLTPRAEAARPDDPAEESVWLSQLSGGPRDAFWDPVKRVRRSLLLRPDGSFNSLPFDDVSPSPS